jgi:hypothetical protein
MSKADIVFKGVEGVGSITFTQPTSACIMPNGFGF